MKNVRLYFLVMIGVTIVVTACGGWESRGQAGETITAAGLQQRLQQPGEPPLVVDVREPHEYNSGHIEGAKLAPFGKVVDEMAEVDRNREIVLVCQSGNRSGKAQKMLAERGFTSLKNMEGGMLAWQKGGYPVAR